MALKSLNQVGESIPADTPHAVSVSLPTWKANVGYEEGEQWVMSKMRTGYPRFFIQKEISDLAAAITGNHRRAQDQVMLFPSQKIALRCIEFLRQRPSPNLNDIRIVGFGPHPNSGPVEDTVLPMPVIIAVIYPPEFSDLAKSFWQHTGDGISSRRAEFGHRAFNEGRLLETTRSAISPHPSRCKGPRRYQKPSNRSSQEDPTSSEAAPYKTRKPVDIAAYSGSERSECAQYIEERFGRNLDPKLVAHAKLAIRRRIAGSLTANLDLKPALEISAARESARQVKGFSEDDVYLYPTGMSSIFNIHRVLSAARSPMKSICFGFPYIDTLKVLEKWGPGCLFYGHGSAEDLENLEQRLRHGEKYLALFCEFPGNPLLKSPDLQRIRRLADQYDFAVVVDETVGNFMNVHVLPYADIVVSSLTKVFSGDSNVMGGSLILNPNHQYYSLLKKTLSVEYEDNYWAEDAIFMERNSRDFVSRIERINVNAEAICDTLRKHPRVKAVYYPKYSPTRPFYDHCRTPHGGYGGLLSVTFKGTTDAVTFFDRIETAKGPSLGTNFTLCSPYTLLAHYAELDWAAEFGVEADLVRISVGLEDVAHLVGVFERALDVISKERLH